MVKRGQRVMFCRIFSVPDIDKPKVYKEGRICKRKGCNTTLSIYNSDKYCYLHQRAVTKKDACGIVSGRKWYKLGRKVNKEVKS